jgi:hypothetical protein
MPHCWQGDVRASLSLSPSRPPHLCDSTDIVALLLLFRPMLACGWKARTSAHLLVDKHERRAWTFLLSLKPAEAEATTTSGGEAATEVTTSATSATAPSTLAPEESAPQPISQ